MAACSVNKILQFTTYMSVFRLVGPHLRASPEGAVLIYLQGQLCVCSLTQLVELLRWR